MSSFWENPGASIPIITKTWAGVKAIYRFCNNAKVNVEKILKPHTESTLGRL
ncbi:MAG: hypothetical protein H7A23_09760 [Leptospiraceae bacterium]|nr:hypothetical protein [Leptospiraceae bacterium]